ncbi:hypothetical protein RRG08_046337 [Elysia crispata]|uniref:Uncharacterized protein n=1 Tax=Elysia crispata TaxID=231223 RepID=A0AAE1DTG6_9GAST|nr:hypothetical protein RRG08_046337 [Elysia crispata]
MLSEHGALISGFRSRRVKSVLSPPSRQHCSPFSGSPLLVQPNSSSLATRSTADAQATTLAQSQSRIARSKLKD